MKESICQVQPSTGASVLFCYVMLYYPQSVAAYIPQVHELKRDVKSRKCGLWVNTFVISWQMNTLTLNYLHKL